MNEAARNDANPPSAGCLRSRILTRAGFRHAFFTRHGGASEGPFRSLSFSTAVGDRPEHVDENLRRAGEQLGVTPERILYLSQVHGSVTHFYRDAQLRSTTITLGGDAIGGTEAGSAYGVRSADCVPILLADVRSGAVMAVHAGWRGVVCGVVEAAVERLRRELPAPPELLAAVGPHISLDAFEVSEEVAAELLGSCPSVPHGPPAANAVVRRPEWPKPHVDLRLVVSAKLQSLGLNEAAIEHVGGCTVLEPTEYFSFRRDGKTSGRHLSAIVPKPFPV